MVTKLHLQRIGILSVFATGALAGLGCSERERPKPPAPAASTVVAALNASPKTSDFVVEATNSIKLGTGGLVVNGGDLGARGTTGPFLSGSVAIDAFTGVRVQTTRNLIADSVRLGTGVVVGDVQTNHFTGGTGGSHGSVTPLVPLPALPAASAVSPGTANLTVATGATVTASAFKYATVSVGTGSTLRLPAGTYQIRDLTLSSGARVEAQGHVEIRIANRLSGTSGVCIAPKAGLGLTAKDVRIEVSGINGTTGAITATPRAAVFTSGGNIQALMLVPNGTLQLATGMTANGAFMAKDVDVGGSGTQIGFQDGFPNAVTCTPPSCDDGNPCTTDVCGASGCTHTPVTAGTSCSDGNPCNGNETCNASGACTPGTAVVCTAQDVCHDVGVCDPATGLCSNPAKPPGTSCSDGNPCNGAETCNAAGTCTPGTAVVCTAQDICHDVGTCNPSTGLCSNPTKPPGTSCSDGNPCNGTETCNAAGACTPGTAVVCTAQDICHDVGTCDPSTGVCSNPAKPPGTSCSDGNPCNGTETCNSAGACAAGMPVTCIASDACHLAGSCDPLSGACSNPPAPDGNACSDGNACTMNDSCQAGSCVAGTQTPDCGGGGTTALEQTQTVTRDSIFPRVGMNATVDHTAVTPGDHVTMSATLNYSALSFAVFGDLDTTNITNDTAAFAETEVRTEYFSPSQNAWVVLSRIAFDDFTGQPLPGITPNVFYSITMRENPGPGVHATTFTPFFSSLDPGATARWNYVLGCDLTPANLTLLADPSQASALRGVIHFEMSPAGSGESTVDLTPFLTTLSAPPVALPTVGATLFETSFPAFFQTTLTTPPLTTTSSAPLVIGSTAVYTGEFIAPYTYLLQNQVGDFAFWRHIFPDPATTNDQTQFYWNNFKRYTPYQLTIRAQGSVNQGIAFFLTHKIPVVRFTPHVPVDIISGTDVEYSVDLVNDSAAPATQITLEHFADPMVDLIPGSTTSVPSSLGPAETATSFIDFQAPFRPASGPFLDLVSVKWKDVNGNDYGTAMLFPGSTLHVFPQGTLRFDPIALQILGDAVSLDVTARDALDLPVAAVPVHFEVTGDNPHTFDVLTGPDGVAHASYQGTNLGTDRVVATGTVVSDPITSDVQTIEWARPVVTPCTGRATPLDIMLLMDMSLSMVFDGKLQAAGAATDRFVDGLTYNRDQIGLVIFSNFAFLDVKLGKDPAAVKADIDQRVIDMQGCDSGFGGCSSPLEPGLQMALDELEGPRHRPEAAKVIIYVGDGGSDTDPSAQITRLKNSDVRVVAISTGSDIDGALVRRLASSTNDYFYAPGAAGIDFAYNNLNQDLCRNLPPVVSAGGDHGLYNVRMPSMLALQGEVHDDGPDGDQRVTSEWTVLSGPGPVTFADPSSPVTSALFFEPGTYVLQLTASDGFLTVADHATITVDPDPSIVGANLAVALSAPGPLEVGQAETLTATLTDGLGTPIRNFAMQVTVSGANPTTTTLLTNDTGVATFTYRGAKPGTDMLRATALGSSFLLDSAVVSVAWIQAASGGAFLTQGWIGAPLDQSTLGERVPVRLAPDVTLASGTVKYFPATRPAEVHILASNVSGAPGDLLATFDTTVVPNDSYVLQLDGTDQAGNQKTSVVFVKVTGDYKPGRVVVELTDFTLPLAGLPITIGRRYDSLEKDKIGDFGYGWSLAIGHPRVEVDSSYTVTVTLPNGRRAAFGLQLAMSQDQIDAGILNPFPGVFFTSYKSEPGVFGTLTQVGGCGVVRYNPANPDNPLPCFFTGGFLKYAPDGYVYTDPYGTAYFMLASGELKSITDHQGNSLSFEPNGIISNTGKSVTWERDSQGRITRVLYPQFFSVYVDASDYTYDAAGNLATVELAEVPNSFFRFMHHTYDAQHRLLTSVDARGNTARTSTYDADGRLATDKDALGNVTNYAYDLTTRTNTTTNPDTGVVTQVFDERGLLLSETDPLGNTTTHQYDANRNETTRTNALGEQTTAIYDEHGNQTSLTDAIGTTHTTYKDNLPVTYTDRLGHTTTIDYDDRRVPTRIADELGTRYAFTNSEQGLPTTITDAAGHKAFLTYDAAGNMTSRTDWIGRITKATYDEAGHTTRETTALGGVTTNLYSLNGKLGYSRDAGNRERFIYYDQNDNLSLEYDNAGRQTNNTYDGLNHLTETRHYPDNTVVSYTRDYRGNPLTMTDESGHTTAYEYDLAGQLTKTTFADGTFTTRSYDALNRVASTTDERGNTTTYQYQQGCDCGDRLTVVTDALGRTTTTVFDANGLPMSITDAGGHTTTFVYDVRRHLLETHHQNGTVIVDTYDSRGRRVASRDQNNATTTFDYDDQGQLITVTDPLSNVTTYAYDLDGNRTSEMDANGHATTFEYDLLKRRTKRTLPLGQFETFAYDLVGNQIAHTDFRGKTTTMTYDGRDRPLTRVPDASLGEPSHSYAYSPTGMRLSSTDGSGTTTYAYDLRDRLVSKAAPAGTLTYSYDATGNVATVRSSNANGTSVDYNWDAANQLLSVTDNRAGGVTTAAYTPTRMPSTLAQPNGVGLTYAYDTLDRVTSMLWQRGMAPAFASWAYTHNERGQRLSATDVTGRTVAYTYDAASRLTSEVITADPRGATFNGVLSYILDGAGNQLARTSSLPALPSATYSYDANGQLGSDTYDDNGNTISNNGHFFTYDFADRLVSADGGATTIVYNCDGDRIAKTVGGTTTQYVVDDLNPTGYLQVLEELVDGVVQTRYTYGTKLVSQTRDVSSSPATSYYGYDAQGNVTFLTDTAGAVTDSYDYDAWGNLIASAGTTPNRRLYGGDEFDPDLGLINLRARQYKPDIGRFLTLDLAPGRPQEPLSRNRYLYAQGDPANRVDPLGLDSTGYFPLLRGIVGTLTLTTTITLGAATKGTAIVIGAAVAAYAIACTYYIIASALDNTTYAAGVTQPSPPPPFTFCRVCKPCQGPLPQRLDIVPPSRPHWPCPASHIHTFVWNQNPRTCQCFVNEGPVICI